MSPEYEPGLVSVIVPTYNRAHLIVETLDSVFAQTYRPIELLIVDDGSTDNTADVVRQWQQDHQQDGFTTRFIAQENRGAPAARNLGLIESRGEFIQFLDSDDLIHLEKIERQAAVLKDNEVLMFVVSEHALFSREVNWSLRPFPWRTSTATLETYLDSQIFFQTAGGIYRRTVCIQIGPWNETLRRGQESEYHARLLMATSATQCMRGLHTLARVHDTGRISDAQGSADGVRAAKESIQAVEHALQVNSCVNRQTRNAIAKRYAIASMQAIRLSDRNLAAECIRLGRQLKPSFSVLARLLLAASLHSLPTKVFMWCAKTSRVLPDNNPVRRVFVPRKRSYQPDEVIV